MRTFGIAVADHPDPMTFFAYAFEAKSIQAFVSAGGRLRHMIGASALVDLITTHPAAVPPRTPGAPDTGGLLARAIAAAKFPVAPEFLRCAGGVFAFVTAESAQARGALDRFQNIWSLAVQRVAPGLSFVDARGEGATRAAAMDHARAQMEGRRSFPAHRLPQSTPLMELSPRTGRAAVGAGKIDSDDVLDEEQARKELYRRDERIVRMFVENAGRDDWPSDLEDDFPFPGEDRTVAILHADGNRMGEIVKAVSDRAAKGDAAAYSRTLLAFSDAVRTATIAAARAASAEVLAPARDAQTNALAQWETTHPGKRHPLAGRAHRYPARPIVLGGDDLAILLRADVALDFTVAFLKNFSRSCEQSLAAFSRDVDAPKLTACAGLVFIRANQPFLQAHALAESLCKAAKTVAKRGLGDKQAVPATIAFHRVTGSAFDDWDSIVEKELTTADGRRLTAQPYLVEGAAPSLPRIEALVELVDVLDRDDFARGPVREIATLFYAGAATAQQRWSRLLEVLSKDQRIALDDAYGGVATADSGDFDNPFAGAENPLFDAVTLLQIRRRAA